MPNPPRRRTGRALLRTALALVGALAVLAGPPGAPAHADDDDYVSSSPSTCQVGLDVDRDGRLVTLVEAHTSGNVGLRGTVHVRVTRNGRTIADTSRPYRGKPLEVLGPRLGKRASYVATMRFTPSGAAFQSPCSAAARMRYAAGSDGSTDPDEAVLGANGSTSGAGAGSGVGAAEAAPAGNGLLPGTGGPALWTLALGLGLLAAGAVVLRRRRAPA